MTPKRAEDPIIASPNKLLIPAGMVLTAALAIGGTIIALMPYVWQAASTQTTMQLSLQQGEKRMDAIQALIGKQIEAQEKRDQLEMAEKSDRIKADGIAAGERNHISADLTRIMDHLMMTREKP